MLNKPIGVGMAILDLSRLHMYEFYSGVLKEKYQDNVSLAYTDTDSFVLNVQTDDMFEGFKSLNKHMGFSDYPKGHPNFDRTNKNWVASKMKSMVN